MMDGFIHVFASGVLLLLTTATTTPLRPATAFSSELTDSPATGDTTDGPATSDAADATESPETGDSFVSACFAEMMACTADDTCVNCLPQDSTSSANRQCGFNPFVLVDDDECNTSLDYACCLDDLSESECLDNEAFYDYFVCGLEYLSCSVDEITCDGAESTTETDAAATNLGPASTILAFSSAFTVLLPLLWGSSML